jgi:hypothetical protein
LSELPTLKEFEELGRLALSDSTDEPQTLPFESAAAEQAEPAETLPEPAE